MLLALAFLAAASDGRADASVVTLLGDAKFEPVNPANPAGPAIAVLSGDPATGPSVMLMRFGRGPGRLHIHSADYRLTVIRGEMKHWDAGGSEAVAPVIGPGGHWFQPGGQAHADTCLSDECLMVIHWSGARDARLAPGAG
ncbi:MULTISPECIES: DUF4437 domain-containing protein [unclassified Sphingopyxis]|uniref:DUF4437 domain-containing protein n=1 Tax=unclassified Sphingopyxis TaxID=2614943 RepID=UPI000735FF0E|nr:MULTISPECIES: DUF4437 domain-containing protein [unclassified Sphingopyxis]KTE40730.1 hypothetical protein ATE62_07345 [Sphingopyxis sp. HIX]KTE83941.1 hypothetical protein ATE72_11340 [Sphingopyxis sp. HXXIV]